MPRDPAGIYTYPPGIEGVPDQTIESADYNSFLHDVQADLNLPRPIVAGGSGAASADAALDNLSAEKFKQVVTNWDTTVWRAGSFYAATTATGTAPVASHAFAGIVYYANASDFIIEATDITDTVNPVSYIRIMAAGVWGNWMPGAGASSGGIVYTFDNTITFPPSSGQIRFNNATQNSTSELFISHLTALGTDNSAVILASIKTGFDILIQDKDEPTKYKIFTATSFPVLSGSDYRVTVSLKGVGTDIVSGQRVIIATVAGDAVLYSTQQGLSSSQQATARLNIGVMNKNYVINGAMMVSQENGSTIGTIPSNGAAYYPVDMFIVVSQGTAGTITAQQIASTTPATPGGSPNRLQVVVTVTDGAVAAGDIVYVEHRIEGLRTADLMFGTATAKTVTVRFGVKAPAGTYCVTMLNGAANRSYVREYTISAGEANTDVIRQVTFIGDTTGIWAKDNTAGMYLRWGLMAGSTFQQAAGTWGTTNAVGSSNQFNFMAAGNTFNLFDVSLTESAIPPPYIVPDFASELEICKRYFRTTYSHGTKVGTPGSNSPNYIVLTGLATAGTLHFPVYFGASMRALPTCTMYSPTTGASGKIVDGNSSLDISAAITVTGFNGFTWNAASAASVINFQGHWVANARL